MMTIAHETPRTCLSQRLLSYGRGTGSEKIAARFSARSRSRARTWKKVQQYVDKRGG
jgi:hypothetical protein